jgi:acyl-CoA thioesterase I
MNQSHFSHYTFVFLLFSLFFLPIYSAFSENKKNNSQAAVQSTEQVILFLGDSLTEGYGMDENETYVALLEQQWKKSGRPIRVLNGSISGSTSASAMSRLRWFERANPTHLVLALGANDGLRGLPVEKTKAQLAEAIDWALQREMKVLLAGMMMPPNYGAEYAKAFQKIFQDLAKEKKITLIPFLLEGVAGVTDLNLSDGIHPNSKGHQVMKRTVEKYLEELL